MEKCKTCANGYPSVSCTNCGTGFRNYVEIGHTIEDYIRKATKQTEELQAYKDTGLTPEQIDRLKIICKKHFTEEEHYASIEELAEVEQITEGAIYGIPRK